MWTVFSIFVDRKELTWKLEKNKRSFRTERSISLSWSRRFGKTFFLMKICFQKNTMLNRNLPLSLCFYLPLDKLDENRLRSSIQRNTAFTRDKILVVLNSKETDDNVWLTFMLFEASMVDDCLSLTTLSKTIIRCKDF